MRNKTYPKLLQQAASHCLLALGLATGAFFTTTQAQAQGSAPVAELAGSYMGVVRAVDSFNVRDDVSAPPPAPIPNEDLGARVDMTVSSTGGVSGKMTFGPTLVPFAGALSVNNGQASVTLRIPIAKYNRSILLTLNPFTNLASGSLAYGIDNEASGGQAMAVYKNVWSGRQMPSYLDAYQTFAFSSGKSISPTYPMGSSFGTLKRGTANGTYLISGTLADGQKFTTSGFFGSDGELLIYQYLYAALGGGVFSAQLNAGKSIQESISQAVAINKEPYVNGSTYWLKRPSPRRVVQPTTWKRFAPRSAATAASADNLYPEGFVLYGFLEGGAYVPPAAGQVLNIAGSPGSGSPASINTDIRFDSGFFRLAAVPFGGISFIQGLNIASPSPTARTNTVTLRDPKRNSVRITQFDVSTGLFKGTFVLTPPLRTATFEGMLVKSQYSSSYQGFGYFLILDLEGNNVVLEEASLRLSNQRISGRVYIGPTEDN